MSSNLRNFDLTVDEIVIVKMMEELIDGLERLEFNNPLSPRTELFRSKIDKLEEKLEQIRDNTLIR